MGYLFSKLFESGFHELSQVYAGAVARNCFCWHNFRSLELQTLADGPPVMQVRRNDMGIAIHKIVELYDNFNLTHHAWVRMSGRSFSPEAIRTVLRYGRVAHVRGASIYAVGRKEVEHFKQQGINLSKVEGIQVVCSNSGSIITVYRNHDFRGLKPRIRRIRRHFW